MIMHVGLGCLMMHDMYDLQCLNVGITPGCYTRPQAVRILRKQGDEVEVVEEEDATRELRRLESTLSTAMKQIKVGIVSLMFIFNVRDWSSS